MKFQRNSRLSERFKFKVIVPYVFMREPFAAYSSYSHTLAPFTRDFGYTHTSAPVSIKNFIFVFRSVTKMRLLLGPSGSAAHMDGPSSFPILSCIYMGERTFPADTFHRICSDTSRCRIVCGFRCGYALCSLIATVIFLDVDLFVLGLHLP